MASDSELRNAQQPPVGQFATTQWSVVLSAGGSNDDASCLALEKLCRAYWLPLYAYIRRRVVDVHEAQDLTQAFFTQLLEKRYLIQADPARGQFRAFLITAFKHFLAKEWDRGKALKRGGGHTVLSLEFSGEQANLEPVDCVTAEKLFEKEWAIALLNRVMDRLQREMERSGKSRYFQAFKSSIGRTAGVSYSSVAGELGISEAAARMAASRLRGRFRGLLRDEIAQTVSTLEEVDSEIQQLFAALAN